MTEPRCHCVNYGTRFTKNCPIHGDPPPEEPMPSARSFTLLAIGIIALVAAWYVGLVALGV